ncbi:MAG: molybdopterin molybdotransferase MoeA [Clostridia bacterium]|nr:molybdopterin molybdotransferase MoeA [Clostridia bacterium]
MQQMLALEAAQELVLSRVRLLKSEVVPLTQASGRVLAQDIKAKDPLPPFNRSAVDGYAVVAQATQGASPQAPVTLQVIEEVAAGYVATKKVSWGTAIRILTGAPVPEGADAVVRQEEVERQGELVKLKGPSRHLENIDLAGRDVATGELVLAKGTRIGTGEVGMLAALGHARVEVFQRPRVAIVSTGDEIIDVAEPLAPGKVRNSNLYALAASVEAAGGKPILVGAVPDDAEAIARAIMRVAPEVDLIISSGGVSVGDYDLVHRAWELLGAEVLFWKVAIKPGTPILWGQLGPVPLAGLSGNPAACLIGFEQLVRPVIRRLGGYNKAFWPQVTGILEDAYSKASRQRRFLRARARWQEGEWRIRLTGAQSPGILRSMLGCNALVDVPAGSGPLAAGEKVKAWLLIEGLD